MPESDERWVEEILAGMVNFWDAISEFQVSSSQASAKCLLETVQAISEVIERHVSQTTCIPEQMTRTDLDVQRLLYARKRADDSDVDSALSVRIPDHLLRYLNRFQSRANGHRSAERKREITKQQMIAEALCLFYAVHRLPSDRELI